MEYLVIAYVLIAAILTGYAISLRQRTRAIERERIRIQSREE